MSVYNEKIEWLSKAVESIQNQTYTDFEFIIIIDNPALDKNVIAYLEERSQMDSRLILHYNSKNLGLMNSLNVGIQIAKGEYIARMDADDISFPDRLEKEFKYLVANSYDMVSAKKINIDEEGCVIGKDDHRFANPNKHLAYTNFIVHPLVLIKTSVIKELGGYRCFHNSEDYDMWLRVLSEGYSIGVLNEYLLYYRIRQSSMSSKNQLETYYIVKYQQQLYRERVKNGFDSFSKDSLNNYLNSKNITDIKIIKYNDYKLLFNEAILLLKSKRIRFIYYYLKACFIFPSIALQDSIRLLHLINEG